MKNIDYSIIILNNNSDNLMSCLNSIVAQDYNKEKIEIIIATTKLNKELKDGIKALELNTIVKEYEVLDLITAYNDAKKIASGKYIHFINSGIRYNNASTLNIVGKYFNTYSIVVTNMLVKSPITNKQHKYLLSNNIDRLIDLNIEPSCINLCLESYFFHKELIKDIKFDKKLGIEAQQKYLADVYLQEQKYYNLGSISLLANYVYEDDSSNPLQYHDEWYDASIINWTKYLKSLKKVPKYIQEIIVYLLYIKFKYNMNSESKYESNTLFNNIKSLLQYIEDDIIFSKNNHAKYTLIRPVTQFLYHLKVENNEILPIDLTKENILIYAINYEKEKLVFDCALELSDYIKEEYFIVKIYYGTKEIPIKRTYFFSITKAFNKKINELYTFQFIIDINHNKDILKATYQYQGEEYNLSFNFKKLQSRLDNTKSAYWSYRDFTIQNKINYLIISKRNSFKNIGLEFKYLLDKFKNGNNKKRLVKLSFIRILYHITKPIYKNKHIWITYDKLYKAGDNGEYLYQYGLDHNKNIYYIIKKDSNDYERLINNPKNKVLVFNSLKAKLYALHAEVILKTHAGIMGYCGFDGIARDFIHGILNAEVIEVQHGLTIQDIPEYQNRLTDNIKRYCIASEFERKNIMQAIYDYHEHQIKMTGIARYDGLKNKDTKTILITPTWRHNLASPSLSHGTQRAYNNTFKASDYYKIYNALINDERLIDAAKKYNYRITYLIHPTLATQIDDFDKNDYVDIIAASGEMSYEKVLCESSIMVTDYSGVQYDFAYMRKPLVYFHPKELPPHYNNGSIDYKKDGFGPITTTLDDLVTTLCDSMKSNCKNNQKYIERADKFFAYADDNNAKRIIAAVEEYLKEIRQ